MALGRGRKWVIPRESVPLMRAAGCVAGSPVPSGCQGARHLLGNKGLCGDETGVTWFLTGELLPAAETRNPGVTLFRRRHCRLQPRPHLQQPNQLGVINSETRAHIWTQANQVGTNRLLPVCDFQLVRVQTTPGPGPHLPPIKCRSWSWDPAFVFVRAPLGALMGSPSGQEPW